jgi:hypothetical protein
MAFGTATVVTTSGKVTAANRLQTTPGRNAPKFIAMGNGATTAARTAVVGDTALSAERETRATGTESIVTVTNTNDAYQTQGTITATSGYQSTGAAAPIDEAATFDASSAGNIDISATFTSIGLASGDSLQLTFKHQMT